MKRQIFLLLLGLTTFGCLFAQTSKNPFSQYGYKKQVMYTSSKGEFEEFHSNEDIVEIGSVYFNTKTKSIVGYVNEEDVAEVAYATSAMSVDPLCEKYYWISPYAYCLNNPVRFVDPDGRLVMSKQMQKDYPALTEYVRNLSSEWNNKSAEFKTAFMEKSGLNERQVKTMLTFGSGPVLEVANLDTEKKTNGVTVGNSNKTNDKLTNANGGNGLIKLDDNVVGMLENAQTGRDRQIGTIMVESTTFHELTHVGNLTKSNSFNGKYTESGKAFEISVYGSDINRSNVNDYWQSNQPQTLPATTIPLLPVQPIEKNKLMQSF